MKIADTRCYTYTLPLEGPLDLGSTTISERSGALLRLENERGEVGWGDAAPLPGFSPETSSTAFEALRRRAARLVGTTLPNDFDGLLEACTELSLPASVQFAVESAAIEVLLSDHGRKMDLLEGEEQKPVQLNALVTSETNDLSREGRRLRRVGFRAVKMKVGRRPIDVDVERVRALRTGTGSDIRLRLDANRAWTVREAVTFSKKVDSIRWEYIEEPLADPSQLNSFVEKTDRPVALDETTREIAPGELGEYRSVAAVVIKPTLLGGVRRSRQWAESARERGAEPVVSACYESGVGLRMLVRLASALSKVPAGLSTYAQLADDVLLPRLSLAESTITIEDVYKSSVDTSRLSSLARS